MHEIQVIKDKIREVRNLAQLELKKEKAFLDAGVDWTKYSPYAKKSFDSSQEFLRGVVSAVEEFLEENYG